MANFFDQFDDPRGTVTVRPYSGPGTAARPATGNFFDQFDDPSISGTDTKGFSEDLKKLTPQVGAGRAVGIGATQGALFGFGDELSGLSEASGLPVGTPPIVSYPVGAYRRFTGVPGADEAYTSARDRFREAQSAAESQHPVYSTVGQLGGALAGAVLPIGAAGRAATLGGNVLRGASVGAGLGVVQGAGEAPELQNVPEGAAVGAGVGGLVGAAVPAIATAARRVISPFRATPEREAAIAALRREGVTDVTAGQRLGSDRMRRFEAEMGGGAAERTVDRQATQFTRAALRRAGIDADRASADVIDAAFDRIGQDFDNFGATANIQPSRKLGFDLLRAFKDYRAVTGESTRAPLIEDTIADIAQHAQQNGGVITGGFFKSTRSLLTRKARETTNPELKQAISDVVDALDDAMEKSVSTADVAAYREARRQYKNMIVLEKAAGGAGEQTAEGIITPAKLRAATQQQNKRAYVRGKGDFAELARAGEMLLKPLPSSGTAQWLRAQGVSSAITGGLGAASGYGQGGQEGAVAGGVAGILAPRLAARAALSRPGRAVLTNQILAGPTGRGSRLLAQPLRQLLVDQRAERRAN